MSKIALLFRSHCDNNGNEQELIVRLSWGKHSVCYGRSGILIKPAVWDTKAQHVIMSKIISNEEKDYRESKRKETEDLKLALQHYLINTDISILNAEWLKNAISLAGGKNTKIIPNNEKNLLKNILDVWIKERATEVSQGRLNHLKADARTLKRFMLYTGKDYKIENFNTDVLKSFVEFIRHEDDLNDDETNNKYDNTLKAVEKSRKPKKRSENTITDILVRIRAFFGWCRDVKKLISISPFEAYKISSTEYGDPIYITKAERDNLYKFDLSKRPKLEIQRDIFIFQSLVGCRVGDLYRLTWDNIANDILCYTPTKTKNSTGKSPEIPLSETAKEILDKYRVQCRISGKSPLFPFISTQKYNVAIKRIFELAGLTREVPHKNPITRENEWLPLYKVASSHMARRNFVGILFEEGVDQSVIISMSGHEEGSKAFERYRKISQEKKAKAIAMLDNNAAQIDTKGLTEEQIKHINEYINSIKQNG